MQESNITWMDEWNIFECMEHDWIHSPSKIKHLIFERLKASSYTSDQWGGRRKELVHWNGYLVWMNNTLVQKFVWPI